MLDLELQPENESIEGYAHVWLMVETVVQGRIELASMNSFLPEQAYEIVAEHGAVTRLHLIFLFLLQVQRAARRVLRSLTLVQQLTALLAEVMRLQT